MRLQSLRVCNAAKKVISTPELAHLQSKASALGNSVFVFDSCQRTLWVSCEDLRVFEDHSDVDFFSGAEAYRFLLSVVLGLESQVVAETDVFGQFKEAWSNFSLFDSKLAEELSPWIQRLFQDAKEIRASHLQNVGAGSYGSLLRKLLKQQPGSEPTLLIGAGKLAQSIAPYLLEFGKLQIWNRSSARSEALAKSLNQNGSERVETVSTLHTASGRVIIAVPSTEAIDSEIIASCNGRQGLVVHLGILKANALAWSGVSGFHSLDDLFAMQDSIEKIRKSCISEARRECEERAKLRALGGSLSIAHGWEDLAVFA